MRTSNIDPGDLLVTRHGVFLRELVGASRIIGSLLEADTPVVALATTEDDVMVWSPAGLGWVEPQWLRRA